MEKEFEVNYDTEEIEGKHKASSHEFADCDTLEESKELLEKCYNEAGIEWFNKKKAEFADDPNAEFSESKDELMFKFTANGCGKECTCEGIIKIRN